MPQESAYICHYCPAFLHFISTKHTEMRILFLTLCLLFLLPGSSGYAQNTYTADWNSLDRRPVPDWWTDAKFGIFIHWGVYSVPAFTAKGMYAEWYQNSLMNNAHDGKVQAFHKANFGDRSYYDLADDFKASLFNPDDWARLFERAGARYVVLTSKHHDGFCLWPSKQASQTWGFPWSSDVRGPNRDLVGDLFTALNKTKVKPGLYYSLYEWYNPVWRFDPATYAEKHAIPQLHDLVNKYQPWVVWADGDWDVTPEVWKSPEFLAWLYNQSPVKDKVVVNDRWGSGVRFKHGGIYTPEYQPDLDFEDHAWEESRGMGFSYGYNRAEDAWDYNSSQSLVLHLIDKVSRGGNFLLDIGPDAYGQIPPIMQERLLDIGRWLEVNGEAIYGSRRWRSTAQWSAGRRDFTPELVDGWKTGGDLLLKQTVYPEPGFAVKEVFFTYNLAKNNLYAICPKYPANRKLTLRGFHLPAGSEITLLDSGEKLRWENATNARLHAGDRPDDDARGASLNEALEVNVYFPEYHPDKIRSNDAYVLRISGFGDFVARPNIAVEYDPKTLSPIVQMQCKTPGAVIRYTTDGTEPRESSAEYKQPFTPKSEGKVRAKAFKKGLLDSREADSKEVKQFSLLPAMSMYREPDAGLKSQVVFTYGNYTLETIREALVDKTAVTGNFDLDERCKTGKCGMIWRGYVKIPQTGGFRFWTESDDGSQLLIDRQVVVDNGGDHGMEEKSGIAFLQGGWHEIQVLYYNSGGGADLKVSWAPLGADKQAIPAAALAH
jgi:alpha-L-fucosidase